MVDISAVSKCSSKILLRFFFVKLFYIVTVISNLHSTCFETSGHILSEVLLEFQLYLPMVLGVETPYGDQEVTQNNVSFINCMCTN